MSPMTPEHSVMLAMLLLVMVMHGMYRKHYGARCPSCHTLAGEKHAPDCQWEKHYGGEL